MTRTVMIVGVAVVLLVGITAVMMLLPVLVEGMPRHTMP